MGRKERLKEIEDAERAKQWLAATGLLPPDMRGWKGQPEEKEEPTILMGGCWFREKGARRKFPIKDEPDPGWDNVVRAYEEDR